MSVMTQNVTRRESVEAASPVASHAPAKSPKIIVIEFNELCPPLLDRFMAEGHLPNVKSFYDSSDVFVTEADVEEPRFLEPWIQWYSMHTGLAYDQHGVYHLTDGPAAGHADIWSVLAENGKKVGNCSSMNTRGFAKPGSFYIPDPWCTTEQASPADLQVFHDIVSRQVREYSHASGTGAGAMLRFARFMLTHGLRPSTVFGTAGQLLRDQLFDRGSKWKRATVLDRLLFDVFRHLYRRSQPDFATFFANSVAHYQHAYWRFFEPEAFSAKASEAEQRQFESAVLYGYQRMDALVGEFMQLAGDDTILVLASALSQQPFLRQEGAGGQHFYRPHDVDKMLARFGVAPDKILPVMTHQYLAHFPDEAASAAARDSLGRLRVEGVQLFGFDQSEPGTLYFGSQISDVMPDNAAITIDGAPGEGHRFADYFYKIAEVKSARHHPDGVFWVRGGQHRMHRDKISVLDVFPTLLDLYGVRPPNDQASLYRGRSFAPLLAA